MKIGAKITAGFLMVLFMMMIAGGVGSYLIGSMNDESEYLQVNSLPLMQKTYVLAGNNGLKVSAIRGFLATGQDSYLADYDRLEKEDVAIIEELSSKAITEQGKKMSQEVKASNERYNKIVTGKLIPIKRSGNEAEAIRVMIDEVGPVGRANRQKN